MIERTFDTARINAVINDSSVYPYVRGYQTGPLDAAPLIEDRRNVALFGRHGGTIFYFHQPGLYEVHTQVLPAGRGKWAVAMAQASVKWMFARTDAVEIMTRLPHGNMAARALAVRTGFETEFTNPRGWVLDGRVVPADIASLTIQRWMRIALGLIERGQWFHDRLEDALHVAGKDVPLHEEDATHDRYVGAAVEMIFGGQARKGVIFYNRWAALAGYAPIAVVSDAPLMIDIRDAILCVRDNGFFVA